MHILVELLMHNAALLDDDTLLMLQFEATEQVQNSKNIAEQEHWLQVSRKITGEALRRARNS